MTTTTSWRLWCLTLTIGGLLVAAGYSFYPSSSGPDSIVPASLLIFVGTPVALMGLVAFALGQSARAGVLGWIGTLLTGLGIAFASNMAILSLADRHALDNTDRYHSSIAGSLEFFGLIALGIGLITLTVATFKAGVYPRWAAWLLVANLAITMLAIFVPGLGNLVHTPTPSYVLMAALGLVGLTRPTFATPADQRESALSGVA